MAELADAPDSKSGGRKTAKIRFLSPAPNSFKATQIGGEKKIFIARALFHHTRETSKHVTLLVYRDAAGVYELFHDADAFHDNLAGTEDFILAEWRKANQQLIESGFQRDNLMGENKFQQYIS